MVHVFAQPHLQSQVQVVLNVCLNLNLVDWAESKLPKDFFIHMLNECKKLHEPEEYHHGFMIQNFDANENGTVLGCNDQRRQVYQKSEADHVIIIDPDILMSDKLLYKMLLAILHLQQVHKYFVLTPQLTRVWDPSWDPLVAASYLQSAFIITPHHGVQSTTTTSLKEMKDNYINRDGYQAILLPPAPIVQELGIRPIFEEKNKLKFAGGWVTCFPLSFARALGGVPNELGSYGQDDLYLMIKAKRQDPRNFEVIQFVLQDELVIEDNKFKNAAPARFLTVRDPHHLQKCKDRANEALPLLTLH